MTNVVMPQMGESIAEGTIVRWIKKVGDAVDRDEPLFEISTDKVDAEIPSPAAGVLTEIRVKEGETVAVNSVVADDWRPKATAAAGRRPRRAALPASCRSVSRSPPTPPQRPTTPRCGGAARTEDRDAIGGRAGEDSRRQKSSPLVRKIAQEHNVDIAQIQGTGISGRVTKQDILDYIAVGADRARRRPRRHAAGSRHAAPARRVVQARRERAGRADERDAQEDRRAHGAERADVAARHSVYEVDFARVDELRDKKKAEYEARRREAHLHCVHRQGGGRRAPRSSRSSTRRSTATTSSTSRTSTSASPSRSTRA